MSLKSKLFFILSVVMALVMEVEGKKARAAGMNTRRNFKFPSDGLKILGFLVLTVFLSPIIYFLYTVSKDPLTPSIISDSFNALKERTFGNLSKKKPKKKQ